VAALGSWWSKISVLPVSSEVMPFNSSAVSEVRQDLHHPDTVIARDWHTHSNDTVVPVRLVEVWSRSCCTSPRRGVGRRSCTPPNTGVDAPVPHPAPVRLQVCSENPWWVEERSCSDGTRSKRQHPAEVPCGHLLESLDEVVEDRAKRSGNATARRESDSGQLR
jgi:hypothetical protein